MDVLHVLTVAMERADTNDPEEITRFTLTDRLARSKRMLFVRNNDTCGLMLSACVSLFWLGSVFVLMPLVIGLPLHAEGQYDSQPPQIHVSHPIPSSFLPPSVSDLDLVLYPDGLAHVSYTAELDPLAPYATIDLYGSAVDNFVAVGENGFLLSADITDDIAMIHTFGITTAVIDYDIHDLVSKSGRMWKFEIDTAADFLLHIPPDAVLIGLDAIPDNLTIQKDYTLTLNLDSGHTELIYIMANAPTSLRTVTTPPPPSLIDEPAHLTTTGTLQGGEIQYYAYAAAAVLASVVSAALLLLWRKKKNGPGDTNNEAKPDHVTDAYAVPDNGASDMPERLLPGKQPQSAPMQPVPHDPEEIFSLHASLRDDDKDIIRFIFESGGVVLESDLRKRFMEPKTTMWRAVKRLERHGIVTTTKKDMQNQVRLTPHVENGEEDKNTNIEHGTEGDESAK